MSFCISIKHTDDHKMMDENMHNESRISPLKAAILAKLLILVLLTQLGKTFEVIEHIKKDLSDFDNSLSIIFTMNTLLNNKQFAHRLIDFKELYGANSIVIFSSKKYVCLFSYLCRLYRLIHTLSIKKLRF